MSAITLQACVFFEPKKENFYTDTLEESDVIRFPIVQPYDLVAIDANFDWSSGKELGKKFGLNGTIDSLNFQKGYITYYGLSSDMQWGILNIDSSLNISGLTCEEFQLKATLYGIDSKMYYSKSVYKMWINTRQLPWGMEIIKRNKFKE